MQQLKHKLHGTLLGGGSVLSSGEVCSWLSEIILIRTVKMINFDHSPNKSAAMITVGWLQTQDTAAAAAFALVAIL